MTTWPRINRHNNFDVIRLLAALQVAFLHAAVHLNVAVPMPLLQFIGHFPGVPIFFYISGLLVISSVTRHPLGEYAEKRAKRVFPALWVAFGLALLLLIAFGQIGSKEVSSPTFWAWVFTQVTVFQVFNPDMFRDFGVGVINGSLWTIPVEIGFYVLLPIVFWLSRGSRRALTLLLIGGAVLSFPLYIATKGAGSLMLKIVYVSPFAHFWLFALGSLTFIHLDKIMGVMDRLRSYPLGWIYPLALYIAFATGVLPMLPAPAGEAIGSVLLCLAILSLGLVAPDVSKILRGNDISYGLYLYHMLAVNAALALGYSGPLAMCAVLGASIVTAYASWNLLEARVLGRDRHSPDAIGGVSRGAAAIQRS